MNIAVIPARGGSKRIPKKNLRDFCGLPMIAWSIKLALDSQLFEKVIVSTDSYDIKKVAEAYGAEIPFMRPDHLADDFADTLSVMHHAAEWMQSSDQLPEFICCLYATAPFSTTADLIGASERISDFDYCFAATKFDFPIQRGFYKNDDGSVRAINPAAMASRSQDLEEAWHDAGQFYWGKSSAWLEKKNILGQNSTFFEIPKYRAHDIDDEEDWIKAELMFRNNASRF